MVYSGIKNVRQEIRLDKRSTSFSDVTWMKLECCAGQQGCGWSSHEIASLFFVKV